MPEVKQLVKGGGGSGTQIFRIQNLYTFHYTAATVVKTFYYVFRKH